MRKTREATEQTRQAILDAALQEFSVHGYEAARLDDIARAAAISKGAIFWHFKSKQGLFSTLVQEVSSQFDAQVGAAIGEGGTFTDILVRVLVKTVAFYEQNPRLRAVQALVTPALATIPDLAPFWHQKETELEQAITQLAGYFRLGIAYGELRADLEPVDAARAFLALQNGLMQQWAVTPFPLVQAAQEAGKLFARGIRSTP